MENIQHRSILGRRFRFRDKRGGTAIKHALILRGRISLTARARLLEVLCTLRAEVKLNPCVSKRKIAFEFE